MTQAHDTPPSPRDPMTEDERRRHYAPSLRAFESLVQFQWASAQKLSAHQERSTKALVRHAMDHVPFYHDRLDMLRGGADGIDLERWLEVPILTRSELVEEADALTATSLPPEHGGTRTVRSSGTTGGRVRALRTELQDSIEASAQFRFWHGCKLDYRNTLSLIRAVDPDAKPAGTPDPEQTKWGPPWLPFRERGDRRLLPVITPPARQFAWLTERSPTYLHTMPSNLLALAHHVRDHGGDVSGIAGAITGGGALTADIRAQARRWLGVEMYDGLGSTECGLIAAQCPDGGGGYHVEAEVTVVEILQEDGTPCRPGETGLLTVTPLYSHAMPLVRYRLDDWITVGEMCSCGRGLPVLSEIVGRDHTLFRYADGVRSRPEPDSDAVYTLLGPRRWQIAQTALDRIEVRIAEKNIEQPANLEGMSAYVRQLIGRDLDIECVSVREFEPTVSGKFDRMVREFS